MLQRLKRQPWICAQCLQSQQSQKRRLVGLAHAAKSYVDPKPPSYSTSQAEQDDKTLRRLFDSSDFWKEFSNRSSHAVSGKKAGLLQNRYLTGPQGFQDFSRDALKKCQKIVAKILAASSVEEYRELVRDLDRLSDQLCRVIDLVDFIRNVHPSVQIQHAAAFAHGQMFEYMNVLNTAKGLHDQLLKASEMPEVSSQWTGEEQVAARILLKDFAQSAVGGSEETKQRFVAVSNEISGYGNDLIEQMQPAQSVVSFPSSKLKGMDPVAVKKLTSWGTSKIPTLGGYARLALRTVEDAEVRREIYMARNTASASSVNNVERLVTARAELADISGYPSFGHMTLSDKMAQTPEAVSEFLEALAASNRPHVQADLAAFVKSKQSDPHAGDPQDRINPWDREYYATRLRSTSGSAFRPPEALSSYFSVGTVMQGLSRLFDRLYGVRLVPGELLPGETWNDDVRRLDVIDEVEGRIAVIYCDLFERPNKSPNPAHFTLRCSREISSSEVGEAVAAGTLPPQASLSELSAALNDGMAVNRSTSNNTLHQLPTIGFICDFPRPPPSSPTPTLLSFRQVTTLFHEMGHCLHSILGRTTLQNVAGTRCATDIAELPSVLMEHFAADPGVLSLYARHWSTDAPLDTALVARHTASQAHLLAAAETESQILLSALDQALHAPGILAAGTAWSSTQVFHNVYNDPSLASLAEPRGTAWHGFFGHLFQYGAVYYSYLFDRAIAGRLWQDVFAGGRAGAPRSLDRRQGQRYRDAVLRHGGARDGWACVADVLGEERAWMAEGGPAAMREVGRWGAGELGGAVGI